MINLNKFQKAILFLAGVIFLYFSIIKVPFYVTDGNGVVYDNLFSSKAKIDLTRYSITLIVISVLFITLLLLFNNIKGGSKFHLKLNSAIIKKVVFLTVGLILVIVGVIVFNKFSQNSKKADTNTLKVKEKRPEENKSMPVFDEPRKKENPKYIDIKNRNIHSDENFQDFLSFTFHNRSDELMTNIMFKEMTFDKKTQKIKNNFINKKVHLKINDSIKFTFKIEYDELFVHKIRFASGKTVTFENSMAAPITIGDDLVDSKTLRDLL